MTDRARLTLNALVAELQRRGCGDADLYLLGGAALDLYWGSTRPTKDLDLVEEALPPAAREALRGFVLPDPRLYRLDLVSGGLPPLPLGWRRRAVLREEAAQSIRTWTLCASDLVASKLRSWRPHDRADVAMLCHQEPGLRGGLGDLSAADCFETDWWEEVMEPRRDRVLSFLDGAIEEL